MNYNLDVKDYEFEPMELEFHDASGYVSRITCEEIESLLDIDTRVLEKEEFKQSHNYENIECDILCEIQVPKTLLELEYDLVKAKSKVLELEEEIVMRKIQENGKESK